jgi:hypothetical protein
MARESFTSVGLAGSELTNAEAVCGPMRRARPCAREITEPSRWTTGEIEMALDCPCTWPLVECFQTRR